MLGAIEKGVERRFTKLVNISLKKAIAFIKITYQEHEEQQ